MQNFKLPFQKGLARQSLHEALQILQESFYNPNSNKSQVITDIIKNCEHFRTIFSNPVKLNEFAQLARFHVRYEVFDYGSVVQQEGELVNKICIILEGSVEEIQRRKPVGEAQDDRRCKTFHGEKILGVELEIREKSQSYPKVSHGEKTPFMTEISLISKTSIFEQQPKDVQNGKNSLKSPKKMTQLNLPSIFEEEISRKKIETIRAVTKADMNFIGSEVLSLLQTARTCDDSEDAYSLSSLASDSLNNLKMSKDDEKLLEIAAQGNSKIKEDYFSDGVIRAFKVKSLHSGDCFGADFGKAVLMKSDSMFIVSSQKAHFLTLSKENYNKIMKQLERQQNDKIELLMNIFPSFEKKDIKRFSEFFSQKSFFKDEVIYSQFETSQNLYLIHSGEVRLFKGLNSSNTGLTSPSSLYPSSSQKSNEVLLASMVKGQFFGEEKLIEKEQRIYTAISNSHNTVAWVLESSMYEQIKLKFGSFFGALKEQAQEKFIWRAQRAVEVFQAQNKSPLSLNLKAFQSQSSQLPPLQKITSVHLLTPRKEMKIKVDEKIPSHFERLKAYKATFSRTAVLSNNLDSPNGKLLSRPASLKSLDISPVKDLVKFNLRKDLYNFDENCIGQGFSMAMTTRENTEEVSEMIKPKLKLRFIGEKLVKKQKKREKKDFRLSKGGSKIVLIGGQSQPEL